MNLKMHCKSGETLAQCLRRRKLENTEPRLREAFEGHLDDFVATARKLFADGFFDWVDVSPRGLRLDVAYWKQQIKNEQILLLHEREARRKKSAKGKPAKGTVRRAA